MNSGLLDFVARQMGVRLSELFELRSIVNVRFRDLEGAGAIRDIRLDVGDTVNLGHIASDRGGTVPSVHVGHFETHKREFRRCFRSPPGVGSG
jgi:hypothetical protein